MGGVKSAWFLLFHSFRNDRFQQEGFLAICTLCFTFICDDKQSIAFWTGLFERSLPGGEITIRIILTAKEGAALARFPFDQFAPILRASNTDLLKPWFGVAAGWEIRAGNKFAETTITDDKLASIFRAKTPNRFGF